MGLATVEGNNHQANDIISGNGDVQITDEEAALYDRQIRLWGADAQKKLRSCNVLLIGLSGVGSEVAKNIVLAGINSLTVLDAAKVTEDDSLSNLFTCHQIGQNRALASEPNIQHLNPMVSVSAFDLDIENLLEKDTEKLSDIIKKVNVVCLTSSSKVVAVKLNNFGFYGFSFTDLGKGHKFTVEETVNPSETEVQLDEGVGKPMAKRSKPNEPENRYVTKTLDYPSLETALSVKAGKAGFGLTKSRD